jgi:iron complex outermembrane recepter protein
MSELIHTTDRRRNVRWQLLATVSALALMATTEIAAAADDSVERSAIWIELGGQFEQVTTEQETFAPPFTSIQPASGPYRQGISQISGDIQKPLDYSYGGEGKLSFEPEGTDWVLSATVRYGRSNGNKNVHRSTKPVPFTIPGFTGQGITRENPEFADATIKQSQSQAIVDFQAGRDFGLGMFGNDSRSIVNFGVRFAQFHSAHQATLGLDPNNGGYKYIGTAIKLPTNNPHTFLGKIQSTRSFRGEGPSISWDASAPFMGSSNGAEFTFDWSVNAAILFGRQKASVRHQTAAYTFPMTVNGHHNSNLVTVYQNPAHTLPRSRTITVPNIGGMAGLSLKFPNAKVSLGYRADFFFGAMDGGIDAAKKENVGFFGPFASVSVGIP